MAKIVSKPEKATFAAGCFWGVEETFRNVKGVVSTQVGYTGGRMEKPTYEDVCTNTTGHAEAVEVTYDPKEASYNDLLKVFWENHDPTQRDRQGPDVGTQYRSAIFYHNGAQKAAAIKSRQRLQASKEFRRKKVATEITAATKFYRAEEYHQKYLQKHRLGACHI